MAGRLLSIFHRVPQCSHFTVSLFRVSGSCHGYINTVANTAKPSVMNHNRRSFAQLTFDKIPDAAKAAKVESKQATIDSHFKRVVQDREKNAYHSIEQIRKLVTLLCTGNVRERQNIEKDIGYLLESCVPHWLPATSAEQRLQLFHQLWQHLSERGLLKTEHYSTKLRVFQLNRSPLPNVAAFIEAVSNLDAAFARSEPFRTELLEAIGASGDVQQAEALLAEMPALNIVPTELHYSAVVLAHGLSDDLAGSLSVLKLMEKAGLNPTANTLSNLAICYLANDRQAEALQLLEQHAATFSEAQLIAVLRTALATRISNDVLQAVLKPLPAAEADIRQALKSVLIELLHNNRFSVVKKIVEYLPPPVFRDDQDTDTYGDFLLSSLIRSNGELSNVVDLAELLISTEKNSQALHIATLFLLRNNNTTGAIFLFRKLLERGAELRPQYFWPLLVSRELSKGAAGIFHTLREMSALGVACDEDTVNIHVIPNVQPSLQHPKLALKQFVECGVPMSQVYTAVVAHALRNHKFEEVAELCKLYPTRLDTSRLIKSVENCAIFALNAKKMKEFAELISELSRRAENPRFDLAGIVFVRLTSGSSKQRFNDETLSRFLDRFVHYGVQLSGAAADSILGNLREVNCPMERLNSMSEKLRKMRNINLALPLRMEGTQTHYSAAKNPHATFILHPRDMTLEQLECHLIELESKEMNTRGVLRRLLQATVRAGKLDRAIEIKAKCDALGVEESAGMLSAIFELYVHRKEVSLAEKTLKQLHSQFPGFCIDEHKIIDYAVLLVENGSYEMAMDLLKRRAEKHRTCGGDYVVKNVWNLLSAVANYSTTLQSEESAKHSGNLTMEAFKTLRDLGYCNARNTLLGPIVREWLLRGDIKKAVDEFRQIAKLYRCTPLQGELMTLLVGLGNANESLLQRYAPITVDESKDLLKVVVEEVSRVHGAVISNSILLIAFAKFGTENQIRRLVLNPGFRCSRELLLNNCKHLCADGATNTLMRLARGVRGVRNLIDEKEIFDILISHFVQSNNHEAALDLYDYISNDDELKMSQEFLRDLVNLLKANKLEIPSALLIRTRLH